MTRLPDTLPAPINTTLRTVFLVVATSVLAGVAAVYLMGLAVGRISKEVAAGRMAVYQLQDALSTLKDAETGQRGFLLTGEANYLEPFTSAKARMADRLAAIDRLGQGGVLPADDVSRFRQLSQEKLNELDQTIRLRQTDGFDAALKVVRTDAGKRSMDELRRLADGMLADVDGRLVILGRRSDRFLLEQIAVVLAAAGVNLGFLAWAYRRLKREAEARQRAADDLRQQKELLAVTLGSIGDGVIVTDADADARVTFMNQVAASLTGWQADEAIGRPCGEVFEIINETTRQPVPSPVDKVLELGTIVGLANHTLLIRRDRSEIPIDDSGAPIRDADGVIRGVVLVFRDFTEHKAAAAKLTSAREEAEAANIAKDNFLATLSHELRTPLTPVAACLADWESRADLPFEFADDVRMMRRNIDLEARLIDDLLDLTRIVRGKLSLNPEVADVHALIDGVTDMYRSEIHSKQLRLAIRLTADRHHVYADPARLQQVLLNILKNATKFTPAGGLIDVSTFTDTAGQVTIAVNDTGIGMSGELLDRLFQPFEQGTAETVRRYGGLGLGLAISRALMEAQGGKIEARSGGPNQGSTFTVALPSTNAPARSPAADVPTTAAPPASLRILLLEDHADTARVIMRLLQMKGHTVTAAANVAEGLAAVDGGEFDLILSDIGLPDGTGMDFIRTVRAGGRTMPAIALTGFGMEEDVRKCLEAGFDEHLTKPLNFQRLETTIAQVVRKAKAPPSGAAGA